jgi:hypothetical protein
MINEYFCNIVIINKYENVKFAKSRIFKASNIYKVKTIFDIKLKLIF